MQHASQPGRISGQGILAVGRGFALPLDCDDAVILFMDFNSRQGNVPGLSRFFCKKDLSFAL